MGTHGAASESTVGDTSIFTQGGYSGSFSEVYSGKNMTLGGVNLVNAVTVLLSGYLENGVLTGTNTGGKGIGGTFDATVMRYYSPFMTFHPGVVNFNLELAGAATSWALDHNDLKSRTTVDLSTFSSVPEPASWSLMLVGVGALGGALRRRRMASAAT